MHTKIALIAALALALAACAKKTETEVPAPAPAPVPVVAPAATAEKGPLIAPVLFDTGSTAVIPTQEPAVDAAAEIMKSTEWTVLVLGLADASGDPEANKILSQQRADAVAAMLAKKSGVPAERIKVHAIGERLATGTDVQERKVVFVFFEDKGLPLRQVVRQSGVLGDALANVRD